MEIDLKEEELNVLTFASVALFVEAPEKKEDNLLQETRKRANMTTFGVKQTWR